MSKFKKLTFLKVLTTVAWADGEVTQSELNILKTFYRKFDLSKHELDELKPYLNAPISKKEKDLLYRQMIAELSTPSEKKEIVGALENMAQAHKRGKRMSDSSLINFQNGLINLLLQKGRWGESETYFKKPYSNSPEIRILIWRNTLKGGF